jgi:hypothetical protein
MFLKTTNGGYVNSAFIVALRKRDEGEGAIVELQGGDVEVIELDIEHAVMMLNWGVRHSDSLWPKSEDEERAEVMGGSRSS